MRASSLKKNARREEEKIERETNFSREREERTVVDFLNIIL